MPQTGVPNQISNHSQLTEEMSNVLCVLIHFRTNLKRDLMKLAFLPLFKLPLWQKEAANHAISVS